VVELAGVTAGYDGIPVLRDVDLVVERGTIVGVIGPNGAGKSTLLKLLTGQLEPMAGTATLGHNVTTATFAQHQVDVLNLDRTVIEEFSAVLGEQHRGKNVRSLLGAFGFPGDAADRKVGELSGGERTRLALARVMANPVNLLILDEPTNHLDMPSRDVLEDALVDYPGTVLLVTHDRHVIRNTADMIVEVRDGRAEVHHGDYEDLLASRAYRAQFGDAGSEPQAHVTPTPRPVAESREDRAERKRREAERRNRLHRETGALRREAARLEEAVSVAEAEVAEINRLLADPAVYDDPTRARELVARHGEVKDRANDLMAQWERAHLELEAAEARVEQELGA
jgi:ATP-binding cassette, subfamily F, member 3